MSFSGDLRGISLADVFQNISGNRSCGTLRVHWRNTERFVRFENGQIAGFSLGVRKGLPIVDHLVQRGYVDPARLKKLGPPSKRSRKTPCQRIVEGKLLTEEEMAGAITELVAEHVYDLVMQREAQFDFNDGDAPTEVFGADQLRYGVRLECSPLLVEGARRGDEWAMIQRVVGSDRDLFLLLEGWEDCAIDEVAQTIAPYLDGRCDVLTLLHRTQFSRFEVMKAIKDLVQAGAARPCSANEIENFARDAMHSEDPDDAIRLLRQALDLERSNTELRSELADLLEQLDRSADAAAEHATLGFQAARDGEAETALKHYDRAVELNPSDPALHEQRVQLLREGDDRDALVTAVTHLSDLWVSMGLADRAHDLLADTLKRGLQTHVGLQERLGEVSARLGRLDHAAEIYSNLAQRFIDDDEARTIEYLRRGLEHCPNDEYLQDTLTDLETGRRAKRLKRRRHIMMAAAAAVILALISSVAMAELVASRQIVRALEQGIESIDRGDSAATIAELRDIQTSWGWTPSGHRAAVITSTLVTMQIHASRDAAERGDLTRAFAMLDELDDVLEDSPLAADSGAMRNELQKKFAAPPK